MYKVPLMLTAYNSIGKIFIQKVENSSKIYYKLSPQHFNTSTKSLFFSDNLQSFNK